MTDKKQAKTWQENWYGMPGDIKQLIRLAAKVPEYGKYFMSTRLQDYDKWQVAKKTFREVFEKRVHEVLHRYLWQYKCSRISKELMDKVAYYINRAREIHQQATKLVSIKYEHSKCVDVFKGFATMIKRNTVKGQLLPMAKSVLDGADSKHERIKFNTLIDKADAVTRLMYPNSIYAKRFSSMSILPKRVVEANRYLKLT